MGADFATIRHQTESLASKPSVAHIEWMDPLMVAGHWMMELMEWAGGNNCFTNENHRWIELEELVEQNPDKIVLAPCGFSIERSLREIDQLECQKAWQKLRAVQKNEVFISDGSRYFNRPGPRLVDSLKILYEIYHPEHSPGRYEGSGWIRRSGGSNNQSQN